MNQKQTGKQLEVTSDYGNMLRSEIFQGKISVWSDNGLLWISIQDKRTVAFPLEHVRRVELK